MIDERRGDLLLPRVVPAKFFIWWGDDEHLWTNNLPQAFSDPANDCKYQSAIVMLDLEALAARLCDRAGVAFAHIEEAALTIGSEGRST